MRLTCPNCSARYEVDEAMVPPEGRDVQCSNCSQTWFQPGPRIVEPPAPEPAPMPEPDAEPAPAAPEKEPRLVEVSLAGPNRVTSAEGGEDMPRPARRQIDPGVTDILREEAEREARLRRGEPAPAPAPQQEEMALPEDTISYRQRRMAELEGAADAFDSDQISAAVATATAASRREQFPDIEEINSTLRATGDRRQEEANATDLDTIGAGRRRGSIRGGFFTVLILAAMATGVYAYADQITEVVPQVGPVLERFVEMVNEARFWLDDTARSLASGNAGL